MSIKPPFWKRKESRSGSNRGPSAYQPSALPLGHTGLRLVVLKVLHINPMVWGVGGVTPLPHRIQTDGVCKAAEDPDETESQPGRLTHTWCALEFPTHTHFEGGAATHSIFSVWGGGGVAQMRKFRFPPLKVQWYPRSTLLCKPGVDRN